MGWNEEFKKPEFNLFQKKKYNLKCDEEKLLLTVVYFKLIAWFEVIGEMLKSECLNN